MKSFILEIRKKIKEAKKIYNLYYEVANVFNKEYEKRMNTINSDLEKLKNQFDKDFKDINGELYKFEKNYGAYINGGSFDKEETKNKAKKELISICKKIEKSNFNNTNGNIIDYQKYFESFISNNVKIALKDGSCLLYIVIINDDDDASVIGDGIKIEYYKEGTGDNEYTNFKKGIKKIEIGNKTSKFTIDESAKIANKIKNNYIRIPKDTDLIKDLNAIITDLNRIITEISNDLEEKRKDRNFKGFTDKQIEEIFKVGEEIFKDYGKITTSSAKKQKIIEYLTNILDEIKSFIEFETVEKNSLTEYEEKSNYFTMNGDYIKEITLGGISISNLGYIQFENNYIIPKFLLDDAYTFNKIIEAINKPLENTERPEEALEDAADATDADDVEG